MSNIILLNDYYRYELPPEPQFESDILFAGLKPKDQYWRRTAQPANFKELSNTRQSKFIEQEVIRMFETGAWFANNGNLVYLPPDAYFYFNWWKMKDGQYANFRKSQYKEFLFENFCEEIPNCIATFSYKKRRDGKTTRRMARKVWKSIQPKNANKWSGLQSKTGKDASDVCWETLMAGYRGMPSWLKPEQAGSSDPKKKLEFRKPSTRLSRANRQEVMDEEDQGLNTIIDFRDTTEDAYDGQELLDLTLDEAAKWEKARVLRAFTTYTKCVWKDGVKVGNIHMFSSPSQTSGRGHQESVKLWNMGDPTKSIRYDEHGRMEILKKSWFILRYFTGALEGYGGACDRYGECDEEMARVMIREEIQNADPEMRSEIERQLPLSIDDILRNTKDMVFANAPEMDERKKELDKIVVKDEATEEPKYIFGNLEWAGGIVDDEVQFRPSKFQDGFTATGKFCFSQLPPEHMRNRLVRKKKMGLDAYVPPEDSENVIGVDPYDYRRTESAQSSMGAALGGCALDFFEHGHKNQVWFAYLNRPKLPADFYEDMVKAAMFLSGHVQVEAKNKNIIDHFEDRGYFDCLLPKNINQPKSEHKGNAATLSLTDEICSLIDGFFGDVETLAKFWFEFVLADILDNFDPNDTLKAHLTMALGQMLLGFMKRRLFTRKKHKKKNTSTNSRLKSSLGSLYGYGE